MLRSCPISFKQIDGTIARLNATFITLFVLLFLITSNDSILYALVLDFIIRLSKYTSYSPIFNLSLSIKKLFRLKTRMTDAGAKKLAAIFGLVFMLMMIIFSTLEFDIVLYATAAVLLCCSSLESLFNYCIGCEIYHIYKKIMYERM
jgi:hypothetical protein